MLLEHHFENTDIVSLFLSSNIITSKYLPEEKELIIIFKSGAQYIYEDIDLITYIDFTRADSQGSYLNKNIKDKFKVTKADKKVNVTQIIEELEKYKKNLIK